MPEKQSDERRFWLVLEDHKAKVFSVVGPLSEDGEWTTKVRDARRLGRDVTISTVASELDVKALTFELTTHGFAEGEVWIL